ncbi:hypothetical protein [Carnobacterium maltaromaticum]|uniref:hypothetical protein n=1 Tax=Carnobacterium maltaromaticum TaxID=2751 RepID=UPI00191BB7C6|nr:hypothetical protein [Carnobacterium maltaromaticum]CAD5903226.1 conserved hypothetical protein [Carnobacterium maltaromaticum]
MDKKSIKKYIQYKVRQSWSTYPVPMPRKAIRNIEINLYKEFQNLSEEEQEKLLVSNDLIVVLTFNFLDTVSSKT